MSHPPFLGTRFYILKFLGPQSIGPQTGAEHGNSISHLHLEAPQGKERPKCFDGTAWPCTDLSFQPVAVDSAVDSPLAQQEPPVAETPSCSWEDPKGQSWALDHLVPQSSQVLWLRWTQSPAVLASNIGCFVCLKGDSETVMCTHSCLAFFARPRYTRSRCIKLWIFPNGCLTFVTEFNLWRLSSI